jgi:hypothetical protein
MTIVQVLLVFVGIPVAVFLLLAAAVYGLSSRRSRRYRPGRPFDFQPVWFVAAAERIVGPAPATGTGGDVAQLTAGSAVTGSAHGVKGGASGSW